MRIFYRPHSRAQIVAMLRDRLPALAAVLPLRRVVLFGSTAHDRHTIASDIDLLVVYAGEPRGDVYALVRETLAMRGVDPHCYTEAEAGAMAAVLERMVEGGVDVPFATAPPRSSKPAVTCRKIAREIVEVHRDVGPRSP